MALILTLDRIWNQVSRRNQEISDLSIILLKKSIREDRLVSLRRKRKIDAGKSQSENETL
jgi:hypothetical protein